MVGAPERPTSTASVGDVAKRFGQRFGLGCAYLVLYFGAVLVAPIFAIAAGLLGLRDRLGAPGTSAPSRLLCDDGILDGRSGP